MKTAIKIRNQIGNAVPPLLAYAVGQRLAAIHGQFGTCVDVFSGAGGLSLGLELSGWKVIASADNDKYANQTYAFNRPTQKQVTENEDETLLIESDLSQGQKYKEAVSLIKKKLRGKKTKMRPTTTAFSLNYR